MKCVAYLFLTFVLISCAKNDDSSSVESTKEVVAAPVEVKVVVVTMFEIGEDEGDTAGEFQLWKTRAGLSERYNFLGYKDLYFNPETGVLGLVTGIGTAKAAAAVMALGMDTRFDLSHAYWLVAGIAGFDPEDASIGSAAWAEYVVDGDLSHEIDPREMPEDWPFGYFARHSKKPFDENKPEPAGEVFKLNTELTQWAYGLTRELTLPDYPDLELARNKYTEHENARSKPKVMIGDNLAAMTFWHGTIMNDWANQWVDYWTDGEGEFVSSAMEDTGTYQSLSWLSNYGKADVERLMVLRTASNYTMQPPGLTAIENLLAENEGYSGLKASVESAYLVGSTVIDALLENWEVYRDTIPGGETANLNEAYESDD